MKFKDILPWRHDEPSVAKAPEDPFLQMRQRMNDMLAEMEKGFFPFSGGMPKSMGDVKKMDMDISETDREFTLEAELPGIEAKDLDIKLEGGALRIKAEKRREEKSEDKSWHRVERQYGSYQRVLQLPPEADVQRVSADFKNGVLKVVIPKSIEHYEQTKRIPVNS